jgi:hypothetical protein
LPGGRAPGASSLDAGGRAAHVTTLPLPLACLLHTRPNRKRQISSLLSSSGNGLASVGEPLNGQRGPGVPFRYRCGIVSM